jgi:hypothetical protein
MVGDAEDKLTPAKKSGKKSSTKLPPAEVDVSSPPPAKKPKKSTKKDIPSTDPLVEAQEDSTVPAVEEEETDAKPAKKARGRPKNPVPEGEKWTGRTKRANPVGKTEKVAKGQKKRKAAEAEG